MFATEEFEKEEKKKKPLSPPKNRHEWLQRHRLKQWPEEEVKHVSCLPATDSILGDLHEIKQDLKDHAGWDDAFFGNVDSRLTALEDKLREASKRFLYELEGEEKGGLRMVNVESADRFCNPEVLSVMKKTAVRFSRKNSKTEGNKIAEEAIFPGFPGGTAPLLPGKVEALGLMDLVTRLQNFNPIFLKSWKRIAFGDDSISFLQLCFWWLWMEKYKPADSDKQSEVFTRMAETFTHLFMNTTGKRRDEFFQRYPYCMSQALYSTFCQAFPHSIEQFHSNNFRQWLCNNVYELISGIPSPIECWKEWPMEDLDPLHEDDNTSKRPITAFNASASLSKRVSLAPSEGVLNRSVGSRHKLEEPTTKDNNSPSIGPGPTFESVKFGTTTCSPLLQHQLWVHGLIDTSQLKESRRQNVITRRQIKDLPPSSVTYSELLKVVSNLSKQRYKEYSKVLASYEHEIQKALTDYHAARRDLDRELKQLLQRRHKISIEAEKIMATYGSQPTNTATIDGNKGSSDDTQLL